MAVNAQVNHGRWIVPCPNCNSAENLPPNAQFRCRQEFGGCGYTDTVDIPNNFAGIEAVLSHRPNHANRNWLPGESIADLKRENRDHGLSDD